MEPINDSNLLDAQSALCRISERTLKLTEAIWRAANGSSTVDPEAMTELLKDSQIEEEIAIARAIVEQWRDYLEIRDNGHNAFDTYFAARSLFKSMNLDVDPPTLSEIEAVRGEVISELGPSRLSGNSSAEIDTKIVMALANPE